VIPLKKLRLNIRRHEIGQQIRIQWTVGWETLVYIIVDESVNTDFFTLLGLFNAAVYPRMLLIAE
jgi:hypothetical protein